MRRLEPLSTIVPTTSPQRSRCRLLCLALASALAPYPAAANGETSAASIEVTGGPHAGKHSLRVSDVGCELSQRAGKPKYFNANFGGGDIKDPKTLSFVLVRMRNANGPGSPAFEDFEASASFGPVMDSRGAV